MKRLTAAVLAAVLLLCGCTMVREDSETQLESGQPALMQEVDLTPDITINPVLYFLNSAGTRLAAETREISIPQGGVAEIYIVEELLRGPQATEGISGLKGDLSYEYIEVLPDVINLYLTNGQEGGYLSQRDTLNAELAFAATLSDYSGSKYVNVFVDGVQVGYENIPTGALEKITTNFSDVYTQIEQKATVENPDMNAILYFLDPSETYILPEQRKLVFQNVSLENPADNYASYVETLVREVLKGPQNTYNHRAVVDSSVQLLGVEIEQDNNTGGNVILLNFNKMPYVETDKAENGQVMPLAALSYTLAGFIPNVAGIQVLARGVPLEEGRTITPGEYRDIVGSNITLYFPNSSYTALNGTERVIPQSAAADPAVILTELMRGPSTVDGDELWPAVSGGVTVDDVNSVYIAGDVAVVDFAQSASDKMQGISQQNEYIMVYAIVNTLTSLDGVRRVQFLVDGERVESLGGGSIDVIDPLMKNPGIISAE